VTGRREFLKMSTMFAASSLAGIGLAEAARPISRKGDPQIKIGCAAYSYRAYLKGESPQMTLDDFLETAAEIGCDGVELTSYYFPSEVTTDYINKIKRRAFLLGLDICATSVGNRFTYPPGPDRDGQLASVKKWIGHAVEMGAPCMRIFAGGVPESGTEEESIRWVVECIKECVPLAEQRGVILALENHHGVTSTADQVLSILDSVGSEWVGLNLDTGNFRTEDPYVDLRKAAPFTMTTHFKTEVNAGGRGKEPADYRRIVSILREVGYRGYLTLEYEAAEDAKTAVPKAIHAMRSAVEECR
jgi:sugar phosphate isomerase/epimerase